MAKQNDNSLVLNNVLHWVSNDEYGFSGSVYDARWVNIRENSKYYSLYNSVASGVQISNSSGDYITAAWSPTFQLAWFVSATGNIYSLQYNYTGNWWAIADTAYNFVNTTLVGGYGVAIATSTISRRPYSPTGYDGSSYDFGLLWGTVVVNGTFATNSDWTLWANWAISGWAANHAAGATADISQVLTVSNTTKYRVQVDVTITSWTSLTVKMWGATLGTITASWTYSYYRTTTWVSETLAFTPTSNLVASIDNVRVQASQLEENYNYGTDLIETANSHPYVNLYPYFYVAGWNVVTQIDYSSSTWTSINLLTLTNDEEIIGMTNIGTRIYIYTNKINWGNARQYLWDWVSKERDEMIEWESKAIMNVQNNGTYDYVVVAYKDWYAYRELYKVSGWDRVKLYQSGYISDYATDKFWFVSWPQTYTFGGNYMCVMRDVVYISSSAWLWTYWLELPWFPESMCKIITVWGTQSTIQSAWDWTNVYFSTYISNKPWVYYINTANLNVGGGTYSATWYIEYNPIVWDKLSSIKEIEKMQIGYQLQTSATSIQIYIKIDDGSYVLLKTITWTWTDIAYGRSPVLTTDFILASAGKKFYKVQFKVVLNTSSSTYTPKVFELAMRVDDTLDVF